MIPATQSTTALPGRSRNAMESESLLAAIVESSDDAIVSKDLNGVVTSWNQGAERIFGYTSQEMVGKPITLIIPPELHDQEPHILAKIQAGGRNEKFLNIFGFKKRNLMSWSLCVL